jgi:hypothetical protein
MKYHIQSGNPRINGFDTSQFQKSRDRRNTPISTMYQKRWFFQRGQNGRFLNVHPSKVLIYHFLVLTAGNGEKTMPRNRRIKIQHVIVKCCAIFYQKSV